MMCETKPARTVQFSVPIGTTYLRVARGEREQRRVSFRTEARKEI